MNAIPRQPWTAETIRSAHELCRHGTPPAMIGRMIKLAPARVEALLPKANVREPMKCTACGTRDARRDVPLCSHCLYSE